MNGGYVMIQTSDSNVYTKLKNAITLGKPILFYENDTTCYYIDTITIDGDDNIVLTKGGKTITIADDNTITTSGDIQNHLYKYAISFSQTNVYSGSRLALYIYTSKKIDENLTTADFLNLVSKGDIGVLGDISDVSPIIEVVDVANDYLQIYDLSNSTDYEYDSTLTIENVVLLKQLF